MDGLWTLEHLVNDTRRQIVNNTGAVARNLRIRAEGFVLIGLTLDAVVERDVVAIGEGVPIDLKLGMKWQATGPRIQIEWIPDAETEERRQFGIDLLLAA